MLRNRLVTIIGESYDHFIYVWCVLWWKDKIMLHARSEVKHLSANANLSTLITKSFRLSFKVKSVSLLDSRNEYYGSRRYYEGAVWRSGLHVWLVMWRVVGWSTTKGPRCFLEQDTLSWLLSTGWFQERTRAWYRNRTKLNWGPYGRLT